MAPSGRTARPGRVPSIAQRKNNNATGFAKRQASKAKGPAVSDVYEFQEQKQRRSRTSVDTRLGHDELAELGPAHRNGSEEEEEDKKELRARLIGENDENEVLGSDEDEEIDSDAAFEEEDDDRYAGFNFPKSKTAAKSIIRPRANTKSSKSVKFADVDLDEDGNSAGPSNSHGSDAAAEEDEEAIEEDEEEGMVDLLDILDGKAQPYFASDSDDDAEIEHEESALAASRRKSKDDGEDISPHFEDDSEQDEESGSDAEDNDGNALMESAPEEDEQEAADEALANLSQFVSGLDTTSKRKVADTEELKDAPPRKRRIKEMTEAGPESEFSARAASGSQKLNLEDLLAPLASRPSEELLALKKSTKVLSASKAGTLAAPLPTRAQERLDRAAAYEQTKEEIDKWSATMKRIKEADHLSFPLQQERPSRTSNLELNAKFKPTTELETAVDRLLKTARLREEDMKETEDLKMNHLTPEEVLARRTELRKMRDLMFRAEAKAKRVAKIKSKTYRRIRKKERTKLAEKLGDMDEEDPDGEEANMRRELERAKERATLRHKNTGKWAKSMKGRGELDDEQRRDVSEMLDRGEKLRRRIQGVGSDDDESGEDDIDSDADDEVLKASAFDELTALRAQAEVDPAADSSAKSVFQMKFMKDAARRDMQKVNESIDDYVRELEGGVLEDDEEPNPMTEASATVHRFNGRVSYQPGQLMTGASLRPLGSMESTSSSATLKSTDFLPDSPDGDRAKRIPLRVTPPPESYSAAKPAENPWLLPRIEGGPSKGKKNEVLVGKGSLAPDKSKHKLQKQSLKQDDERAKARADAELEISLDTVLTRPIATAVPESGKTKQKRSNANTSAAPEAGDSDDHNSEAEGQEQLLQRKGKKTGAFQQRDLVAQAFAGDNVVQDFADTKRREIKEDAPTEVDMTLQGWGSWGGKGSKKQAPKPHLIKRVAGIDPKSRADYGKTHVIISEKRDKKAAKYQVGDLPYPYTSQAQFERSLDTPLGTEWNTRVGFQRGTLPKIVKKMGTIISPLEKLT